MMNRKIALSLFSIASALVIVGGATYAYFTSSQSSLGNTISTGTMNFEGIIADTSGSSVGDSGKFSVSNLVPGDSLVRCLWVKNTGTTAGRYKIYATAESGDTSLGNLLTISATLNPTISDCSGLSNPFSTGTIYGPDNLAKSEWQNVPSRGSFMSSDPTTGTPFKILSGEPAMPGDYYSLFRITVALDSSATQQGSSYVQDIAIYGMQDAGSLSSW